VLGQQTDRRRLQRSEENQARSSPVSLRDGGRLPLGAGERAGTSRTAAALAVANGPAHWHARRRLQAVDAASLKGRPPPWSHARGRANCFFFFFSGFRSDQLDPAAWAHDGDLERSGARGDRHAYEGRQPPSSSASGREQFFFFFFCRSDCGTPLLAGLSRSDLRLEFNHRVLLGLHRTSDRPGKTIRPISTWLPTKKTNDRWNSSIFNL
jgi:hypothetical protein